MNTNITLTSNVAGTLFTWTCNPSSGSLFGYSDGIFPTTQINQVLDNRDITTESVTYQVLPAANGCVGFLTNYVVTVFPTPTITTAPPAQSQCNNANVNLIPQADVAGTMFTWTCTPSSANITGYSGNAVPAPSINEVLINSGFNTETVIYHLTPWANGCPGPVLDYTVTVFPTPDLSNMPLFQNLCSSASTNVILTSNVAGTGFTWTCTPSSGNITGWSNNGIPTTVMNQTLVSTSLVNESVIYHITPTANGCSGPVTNYTVTVLPMPVVTNNPAFQNQCNNINTGINLLSNLGGTLFTWTCTPSSGNITGWANNGIPAGAINQTLVNTGFIPATVVYHITPMAGGCSGTVFDYTVTVFPTPDLSNNPLSKGLCNNMNTNIPLTSNVPGTLFTWTCMPSGPGITGWSNNAVPSTLISQVLTNSTNTVQSVIYRITPGASGCTGAVTNYLVTVSPTANVAFTPPTPTMCGGVMSNIANTSNVAGALFSWTATASTPDLTSWGPGAGPVIAQTINNSGFMPGTVTYTVTPSINGCPGIPGIVTLTVNPVPVTTFTICNDPVTTVNSRPVTLRGGIPLGGTYTGAGVAGNIFTPSVAGPGNHVITYTYNNAFGCARSATQTLSVLVGIPFVCGNTLTDVRDNQQYTTVLIGTQCWMSKNLNYGATINSNIHQRDNCVVEKYCAGDVPGNCGLQGGFYQWDELMHYVSSPGDQGICPPGWHVPDETEWTVLFNTFGPRNNAIAASNLKATGNSGFAATVIGFSGFNRTWAHMGFATMMWSSTPLGQFKAWAHGMNTSDDGVSTYPGFRENAFSVRCVQD
jgi:uncharacterized protein (TIGR02145 family)